MTNRWPRPWPLVATLCGLAACVSVDYVGKSYAPTSSVEVFLSADDVGRPYETIGEAVAEQSFEGPPHDGIPREASELARAIQMANAEILETASEKPELDGMGTTVCAARFSTKKSATAAATDFATASWPR